MILLLLITALSSGTDDVLQYDDGVPCWYSFSGGYRGTWFNLEDFYGTGVKGFVVDYAQLWFFHVATDPWDTSDFIGEITDGTPDMPGTVFASDSYVAVHQGAVDVFPFAPCTTGVNFTVTEVAAFSAYGAPSVYSDLSPSTSGRSFFADPPGGINLWTYDYIIRVYGFPVFESSLSRITWASLKSTF